ncbi:phosphatidylinositol-specific phospholipase C, X domain protein [Rhodococcus sp. MTM3W5.2]|uniref:phosphatidylinositol-specific phospholipase C n=1 Tax=Rhodococcus sp. MTM3W5.2 TaxID=1805827 RepID=UPI00097982EE|nr:phosphatidylinositol-specific phospholipase C [Rhodococcus sp. MTM3W5.2]AQA22877.1 phosphatidylinositol-specific phospholipase C, X domain protein [Rhodococcus sp. MTM3W5.2]
MFAQTQDADLTTQLRAGVRAVDIRTRHFRNVFPIHHGVEYLNSNFTDVVVALTDFLSAHPTESIVMRLKEEYTPAENTRSYEDTLNWYLNENPETRDRLQERLWRPAAGYSGGLPRLGEARGKIVVLRDFDAIAWPGPRLGDASMAIQDTYELTGPADIGRKWELIRAQFERARTGSPDILFINHLSATGNPAALVTGTVPVTVARGAPGVVGILPRTEEYLKADGPGRLGAVMADFPTAELVTEIIEQNFR